MKPGRKPRDIWDRFFENVQLDEETGCWNWTGDTKGNGYGIFRINSGSITAHNAAMLLLNGGYNRDLDRDHLCHNRLCVNPGHLEEVTHAENMRRRSTASASHYLTDQERAYQERYQKEYSKRPEVKRRRHENYLARKQMAQLGAAA